MAAYIIAMIEVMDSDKFAAYQAQATASVEKYDGKFIAKNGEVRVLEGDVHPHYVVIVEFPTLKQAKDFYFSPEYQQDIRAREGAAAMKIVGIEGL